MCKKPSLAALTKAMHNVKGSLKQPERALQHLKRALQHEKRALQHEKRVVLHKKPKKCPASHGHTLLVEQRKTGTPREAQHA